MSITTNVRIEDQHSDGVAEFRNPTRETISANLETWFIDPAQGGIPEGLDGGVAGQIEDLADAICRHGDCNELAAALGLKVEVWVTQ